MKTVCVNWEGLRRFLGFSGSIEEMRGLEIPADPRDGSRFRDFSAGMPPLPTSLMATSRASSDSWWRCAFYPWGYPANPDGRPDSPLCHLCGMELRWKWEPGLALAVYHSDDVARGETCFRCGEVKR